MSSSLHSPPGSAEPVDEQRLFLRKKVSLPLPIELLPGKEVWLHDLGEGGLSVSGSSRLEPGTATFFKFQFPDSNSVIEASGVVAWCDGSGRVGIRFTRIKPDSSAVLKRWLKSDEPFEGGKTASTEIGLQLPRAHNEIGQLRDAIAAANLEGRAALNFIVERMLFLTRASGAAIALREGEPVICRATVGNAPDVGTRLNLEASITGECYRTGTIVSVTDTENDSRVDAELCRHLEFRSLLIVPITMAEEAIGIAEVFSPVPGNFEGGDILLLGSIAELIAEIHGAQDEGWMIPAVKLVYDIPVLDHTGLGRPQEHTAPVDPPNVETSVKSESGAESQKETNSHKLELNKSAELPEPPQNQADKDVTQGAPTSETIWRPRTYVLLAAFLALLSVAFGDFLDWHLPLRLLKLHRPMNRKPATPAAVDPTQPALARVESDATETNIAPLENTSVLKPTSVGPSLLKRATARGEPTHPSLQRISADDVQVQQQVPSAPALSAPNAVAQQDPAPSEIRESAVRPDQVSPTQLTPAKLIHRVEPIFPDFARDAGLDGTILLSAIIGTDGRLKDMKLVSGNRALATEAFRALREWRYRPYLLNGKPIEAETRIVMNFHR